MQVSAFNVPNLLSSASLPVTTVQEDLYDEGAGAVWGSYNDGGPNLEPGGGTPTLDQSGVGGTLTANSDFGVDDVGEEYQGGVLCAIAGGGNELIGVDDVGQEYQGNVWGTIADSGVDENAIDGTPDMVICDYGIPDVGPGDYGIPDVGPGDYGTLDVGPGDYGTPDIGPGDYGTPDVGPGDYGTPDIGPGDYGTPDVGPGDYGTPDVGPGDYGTPDVGLGDYGTPDIGPGDYGTPDVGPGDDGAPDSGPGGTDMGVDSPHSIVAIDDTATTDEDKPVNINVLQNDQDVLGHELQVMVSTSVNGMATVNASGVVTFVPTPNYNGNASFTYIAGHGMSWSNPATVVVEVKSINDAPVINNPGNMTFTEGDRREFPVTAYDIDSSPTALRWKMYSATLGSLGFGVINPETGLVNLRIGYYTSGTHTVTFSATDELGATSTIDVIFTIRDAGFDEIIATEMAGSVVTTNSITVPGPRQVIFVAPGNDVRVLPFAHLPKANAALEDVRFIATHQNGTTTTGILSQAGPFNSTFGPYVPGDVIDVTVYLDENFDGGLGYGEFALDFTIRIVDFGGSKVWGGRIDDGILHPGEDLSFIKHMEIFDVTSTFEYQLIEAGYTPAAVLGEGSLIRGQMIRPGGQKILFEPQEQELWFETHLSPRMVGLAQVRFYLDVNFNGQFDFSEPARSSNIFQIVERNVIYRTVQYNSFMSLTIEDVQQKVDESFSRALRKDTEDDYRAAVVCIVSFLQGSETFREGPLRPDRAYNLDIDLHLQAHNGITILKDGMERNGVSLRGIGMYNSDRSAVAWFDLAPTTICHEIGHNLGIHHNGLGNDFLMEAGGVPDSPGKLNRRDHLTQTEAEIFSAIAAGSSGTGSSPMSHGDSHEEYEEGATLSTDTLAAANGNRNSTAIVRTYVEAVATSFSLPSFAVLRPIHVFAMHPYRQRFAKVPPKVRLHATPMVEDELQLKAADLDGGKAFEDIISDTLAHLDLRFHRRGLP